MLRKSAKSNDNMSDCVYMMLRGAKKRRATALAAVKSINTEMGFAPNIKVIK